jgi:predicted metal-dependent TIM-barrel fold hydrolase
VSCEKKITCQRENCAQATLLAKVNVGIHPESKPHMKKHMLGKIWMLA